VKSFGWSTAVASLSSESLARYYAYKQTLLGLEQDDESVVSTLSPVYASAL
jgi:hypothetical protein